MSALEAAEADIARVGALLKEYAAHTVAGRIAMARRIIVLEEEAAAMRAVINTPENDEFLKGVSVEAEHQRQRWPDDDARKTPLEWMGVVGYLAGKAISALLERDFEKAKHHTISTSAVLLNWHRRILSERF